MNLGIIFALLTILLYGSWAVPTKTLKINPKVQAFWLTLGHLIVSAIIFILLSNMMPSLNNSIAPLIAGALWAIGITLGYVGIKHLGITRAIGIWVPVNILVGALWGLIFFGEAKILGTEKLLLSLLGIGFLITAAITVISSIKTKEKMVGSAFLGILASLSVGLFHGSVFVPLRASSLPFAATFLPWGIGMAITTSLIVLSQRLKLNYGLLSNSRMLSSGLILGVGNYLALLTIKYLGYTNGFALTQLSIVVNTLWGAVVFKEITSAKGKILIATGVAVALVGAYILSTVRIQ